MGFETDRRRVAACFQAADLFIHTARAEAWGLVITEALACGVPPIATAVGGIPEQVRGLNGLLQGVLPTFNRFDSDTATGFLVPAADPACLASAIKALVERPAVREILGANAARDAQRRFGFDHCVDTHLEWYEEILEEFRSQTRMTQTRNPADPVQIP
jgi:glycosyltransferase involved in cell wall biosynthesis